MRLISRWLERLGERGITRVSVWRGIAWRVFGILRERNRARAALANMTTRELADIGLTAGDRAMALARRNWADPDGNRNDTLVSWRRPTVG